MSFMTYKTKLTKQNCNLLIPNMRKQKFYLLSAKVLNLKSIMDPNEILKYYLTGPSPQNLLSNRSFLPGKNKTKYKIIIIKKHRENITGEKQN